MNLQIIEKFQYYQWYACNINFSEGFDMLEDEPLIPAAHIDVTRKNKNLLPIDDHLTEMQSFIKGIIGFHKINL
jgi:hypothetical protein